MDADYLKSTLGQVVAKGCAETIAVSPIDPIHFLSLWLLKYVENERIVIDFQKEKEKAIQEQATKEEKQRQNELAKQEETRKQAETVNNLASIQTDPYLLFDECLKAVVHFTGCTSAYVALVLDKLWVPPKKSTDSEGEEGDVPNDENPKEEEEEEEEAPVEVDDSQSNEAVGFQEEGGDGELREGGDGSLENVERESKKVVVKRPKPPNYKKKILLYVAATPNNEHVINKQLDKKVAPLTYSVLLQRLPKLHIPNMLYQEGAHFFQGLPLMGAYLTTPIILNASPVQIVALLCVDTLRKEQTGTGRPFTVAEQDFVAAVAQTASQVLSTSLPSVSGSFNTKNIMKDLRDQLQQVKTSHKAEMKRERMQNSGGGEGASVESKKEGEKGEAKVEEGEARQENEEGEDRNDTESKGGEDTKEDDDDEEADMDDEQETEDEKEKTEGDKKEEPEEEEEEKEADHVDEDAYDNQKQMRETTKLLKQQQKKVANLQKNFQKCQACLEKQSAKVSKLEKRLTKSGSMSRHLHMLLSTVQDTLYKYKDEVFGQVKQCLFPTTTVLRVLKALLHALGQSDAVVHDWTRSRQVLNGDICNVMKEYNPQNEADLKRWEFCDMYLNGMSEESLSAEAPIGYLGQQWLLVAKKFSFETIKCNKYKSQSETAAKDFADFEVEQMVAEIDLRVAIDEEKKLALQLEDLQSNFARELSSTPTRDEKAEEEVKEPAETEEEEEEEE